MLCFLYPLAIVLIALCLIEGLVGYHRPLYICTMIGTGIAAAFDFLRALPPVLHTLPMMEPLLTLGNVLPLSEIGMGWVIPSLSGWIIGALVCAGQRLDSTP